MLLLQIGPVNLQNALFVNTCAANQPRQPCKSAPSNIEKQSILKLDGLNLQKIWPTKVTILRVRMTIFHVMWTGAAIWRREGASGCGSSLSFQYGRVRPHHIEYCYPHPKNSYFRRPNLLQISKSAIKQSSLKVDGADLQQNCWKTKHFEGWRGWVEAKVL